MAEWKIVEAEYPSNIEWDSYFDEQPWILTTIEVTIVNTLVVLLLLFVINPDILTQQTKDVVNNNSDLIDAGILFLTNYIIAPQLIFLTSYYAIKFKTKSSRYASCFYKYLLFYMVATLLIPLFGKGSFTELVKFWQQNNTKVIATEVLQHLPFQIYFLFSFSCITTSMYMLDLSHFVTNLLGKFLFSMRKEWVKLSPQAYVDDCYFDLGLFFGSSVTIFTLGTFFSTIAPWVPILCCSSFGISLAIHKYNFLYVYEKEYNSDETFIIVVNVCSFIIFGARVFFYWIMRVKFVDGDGEDKFEMAADCLLGFEILCIVAHLIYFLKSKYNLKPVKQDTESDLCE